MFFYRIKLPQRKVVGLATLRISGLAVPCYSQQGLWALLAMSSARAGLSARAIKARKAPDAYKSEGNAMWPATAEAAQTAGLAR